MRIVQVCLVVLLQVCQGAERPLVISHRGSGYLPELTLATQAMGHALGADMIELDINLSRDDELIVIHGKREEPRSFSILSLRLCRLVSGCDQRCCFCVPQSKSIRWLSSLDRFQSEGIA